MMSRVGKDEHICTRNLLHVTYGKFEKKKILSPRLVPDFCVAF